MLDVEQRSGVTVLRLRHRKVNALDVDLLRVPIAPGTRSPRISRLSGCGLVRPAPAPHRRHASSGRPGRRVGASRELGLRALSAHVM